MLREENAALRNRVGSSQKRKWVSLTEIASGGDEQVSKSTFSIRITTIEGKTTVTDTDTAALTAETEAVAITLRH